MYNNQQDSPAAGSKTPSASPSFQNSYIITNRLYPYTWMPDSTDYVVPMASGDLNFSTSPYPYDSSSLDYSDVTTDSSDFLSALATDLSATIDQNGHANLAVYIHGLGNTYDDAISGTADFGTALASYGNYNGLLIGFSWPSYSEVVAGLSAYYATSRPPQYDKGTIRDNINGSVQSFVTMVQTLLTLGTSSQPLNLSLLSHSEGNYMLMLGMQALQNAGISGTIKNAVMMAADISAAMLQEGQDGQAIYTLCDQVSVYYSGCDDVLGYSDYYFFNFHDQTYPTRLGLIGPYAYPPATPVAANVNGIDCSQVTVNLGLISNVHSCYISTSQIVADIASTLMSASNTGRVLYPGGTNSYYLDPTVNNAMAHVPRPSVHQRSRGRLPGKTL